LYSLRVAIFDLNQSPKCYPFKIFLAFLMDEITSWECPALNNAGQRHRSRNGEFQIVCRANGEIGEEFDVPYTVRSQLEITDWETVLGLSSKRTQVKSLHTSREPRPLI